MEFQFIPMRLFYLFIQPVEYSYKLTRLVASNNNFKNLLNFQEGEKKVPYESQKKKMIIFFPPTV